MERNNEFTKHDAYPTAFGGASGQPSAAKPFRFRNGSSETFAFAAAVAQWRQPVPGYEPVAENLSRFEWQRDRSAGRGSDADFAESRRLTRLVDFP